MASNEVRVEAAALEAFTRDVFIRVGLPSEDATVEAEVLVWANLRGVDSHGVLRIPSYVEMVDRGDMNPRPKIQVVKETAATVLIDADHAFGPVVTVQATRHAIAKARDGRGGLGAHPQHDPPGRDGVLLAHGRARGDGGAGHRVQPAQHGAARRAGGGRPQQPDLDRGAGPAPPAARARHGDERGGGRAS